VQHITSYLCYRVVIGNIFPLNDKAQALGASPVCWQNQTLGLTSFEVKNVRMQVVMTGLVATVMALNIFLLANYDYPFSGDVIVSPTAFQLDRDLFNSFVKQR
jgi:hypothetical protein